MPTILDAAESLIAEAAGLCSATDRLACGGNCCRVPAKSGGRIVTVTLPDLVALAGYLYRPRERAALRDAVSRLITENCAVSPLTGTFMLASQTGACRFQGDDGRCTVYSVRPMLCRLFFHCEWTGYRLPWDRQRDEALVGQVLGLAHDLSRLWKGHEGLLWQRPLRYDEIPADSAP